MKTNQKRRRKIFTSFGFSSLVLISNSNYLKAEHTYKFEDFSNNNFYKRGEIVHKEFYFNGILKNPDISYLLANNQGDQNLNVFISEIIIEGWEDHPEGRRLELAAYDSMAIKPGSIVNNQIIKKDLDSIYASGWFSGVKIRAEDGPLGVKLVVSIVPNPILKKVEIITKNSKVPDTFVNKTFNALYGTTLNLNELQKKIRIIKNWYEEKGYSLARINGPERILENGVIQLNVDEGQVSKINIRFIGADEKVRKGKTKDWVIKRELKTKAGVVFNRKILESDIKRLYATSLFNDVKVSLSPDELNPEKVEITLEISEQRTGSLTGGVGYSNAAGVFAQMGFKETNTFGRAWSSSLNIDFGEYLTTYNFSLFDPWIKDDKNKTAFRTNVYLSRDYPQEFRSPNNRFYGVKDLHNASGTVDVTEISKSSPSYSSVSAAKAANSSISWFDYAGNSPVLQNIGGGFSFIRPLNGGDPFQDSPWRVSAGMNFKKVDIIDSSGKDRPYAIAGTKVTNRNVNEIICIGYTPKDGSCPAENTLISVVAGSTRNNLNNNVNPTSGNILRFGSEQFLPIGENAPTFNRMRASYAWFIPTRLVNLTKECRSDNSDNIECPQTIGFQLKAGTIIGELPPYESFCMGGASSVRGWGSCELAVSKSFAEGSAEYRFPVWRMISGALFADVGSDLGSQEDVKGQPGVKLSKKGHGFSLGGGIGVKTPIGPLRIDIASQDLTGDMRYTLGVGWKF